MIASIGHQWPRHERAQTSRDPDCWIRTIVKGSAA
jgi:hypothetical protein